MNSRTHRRLRALALAATLCGLSLSMQAQSSTSSSLAGTVTSESGQPLADAVVTVVHEPTGSTYTLNTDAAGRFSLSGLRPGGPYNVYARATHYGSLAHNEVQIGVNQTLDIPFALPATAEEEVIALDKYVVVASGVTDFGTGSAGPSLVLTQQDVELAPSVERSINDVARLNPFIVADSNYSNGTFSISAAGKNYRYNKILIDGVQAGDPFGLQSNGLPARGNLITKDAIESISVDIADYDARYSGYSGALINAVTKSGSNEFHGSTYMYYRSKDMVGDSDADGNYQLGDFTEKTYGATLGGPIVKDKLFFFLAYEKVENETTAPVAKVILTSDQQARIQQAADRLGIGDAIGSFTAPGASMQEDKKYLAKLDWKIAPNHRATFRYQSTEGVDPIYYDYDSTTTTSYSSHWADQSRNYTSYVGQLFSDWTSDLSTEVMVSKAKYDSDYSNVSALPRIVIKGVGAEDDGTVELGREESRQANVLNTDTWNYELSAKYTGLLNHTLCGGLQYESMDVYNMYLQYAMGSYTFDSISDFAAAGTEAGHVSAYQLSYPLPGYDAAADFTAGTLGAYLQDEWMIHPDLGITFGLRIDDPVVSDDPFYNEKFQQTFGVANNGTIDGRYVVQPRVSLKWRTLDDRLLVRAGAGLFYGNVPQVWLSNSFSNTGIATASDTATAGRLFTVDPQTPASGTAPRATINYIDDNFDMPSDWRYNISAEYDTHLLGIQAVGEVLYTKVNDAIMYTDDNLNVSSVMGDGREIYSASTGKRFANSSYYNVLRLSNTDLGHTLNVALGLRRDRKDGWAASAFYIYGDSEDVQPGTSSVAYSNWRYRTFINPNEETLATSNYEVKHRFLITLSKQLAWAKGYETNISLVYDVRSGVPFSWVTYNDVNLDGTYGYDLMYVPSGPDDPLFGGMTDASEQAAFFAFIESEASLRAAKGTVIKRNSDTDPWRRRLDLTISQNIKIWNSVKTELYCTVYNMLNLLNDDWGAVYTSSYNARSFASVTASNGKYVYDLRNSGHDPYVLNRESRWAVQLGAKISF